jgi:hypothetical protein
MIWTHPPAMNSGLKTRHNQWPRCDDNDDHDYDHDNDDDGDNHVEIIP